MFQHERIVGFEYTRNGRNWHLSNQIIDAEVANVIGWEVLRGLPVVKSRLPPQYLHLARLVRALAVHKLDGGSIDETYSKNHYRVIVDVKPRKEKPGRHKEAEQEDVF